MMENIFPLVLSQVDLNIGQWEKNTQTILQVCQMAKENNASCVLFPPLTLTGPLIWNDARYSDFLEKQQLFFEKLKHQLPNHLTISLGLLEKSDSPWGWQCHYFLYRNGQILCSYRYDIPLANVALKTLTWPSKSYQTNQYLFLCFKNNRFSFHACPLDQTETVGLEKESFYLGIFLIHQPYYWQQNAQIIHQAHQLPFPCVGLYFLGGFGQFSFVGGHFLSYQNQTWQLKQTRSGYLQINTLDSYAFANHSPQAYYDNKRLPCDPLMNPITHENNDFASHLSQIYPVLLYCLQQWLAKSPFDKVHLGLSGGIDSAVVLVLACWALGKDRVHAVALPSEFSTDSSLADAQQLCQNLGVSLSIIPIGSLYQNCLDQFQSFFPKEFALPHENLQARIRCLAAMAYSNSHHSLLLGTSNKSELAIGYATVYGDLIGAIEVIGDLWKTQVYQLAHYLNQCSPVIPESILTKAPSAELHPGQKDQDTLPEYSVLDSILSQYWEYHQSIDQLKCQFDPLLVDHVLDLVQKNEYKRYQAPPVLKLSSYTLGIDHLYPLFH